MLLMILISLALTMVLSAEIVKNPDKPLKGKWDFQLQKEWEIEEAGDDLFARFGSIDVAKNGNIYVTDSKQLKVFILDKDGKFISVFGKKGEGPGEFIYMPGMQIVDDTLVFRQSGRIHYFDLNGAFQQAVTIPSDLRARTFASKDVFISAPFTPPSGSKDKLKVSVYDCKDKSRKEIAQYSHYEKATTSSSSGGQSIRVSVFFGGITPSMELHYGNGKIFYGMTDNYQINMVDPQGNPKGGFTIEGRDRKPISKEYKKSQFRVTGNIPKEMVDNIIQGMPDEATFFASIQTDANGLIYCRVPDPENKKTLFYDIFSPNGKYLHNAEIKIEDDIERICLRDNVLVLGVTDEDGNYKLVKYTITMPKK